MSKDVRSYHGCRIFMAQMQVQDDACNVEPTYQQLFPMPKGNFARSTIAKQKAGNTMIKKFARYFAAEPTFEESVSIPEARLHRRIISKRVTSQQMKRRFAQSVQFTRVQSACKQTVATKMDLEIDLDQAPQGKEHFESDRRVKTKKQNDKPLKRIGKDPKLDSNRADAVQKLIVHPDSFEAQSGGPTIAELIADIVDEEEEACASTRANKEKDLVQFVLSETSKMPKKASATAAPKRIAKKSPFFRFE